MPMVTRSSGPDLRFRKDVEMTRLWVESRFSTRAAQAVRITGQSQVTTLCVEPMWMIRRVPSACLVSGPGRVSAGPSDRRLAALVVHRVRVSRPLHPVSDDWSFAPLNHAVYPR